MNTLPLILLTLVAPPEPPFPAKVVGIVDGDTIDVINQNKQQIRIRLHGIDAPEKGQPFGNNATKFLGKLNGNLVLITPVDRDRYDRLVADVHVQVKQGKKVFKQHVNLVLVHAGLAWHYEKYAPDDKQLKQAQREARQAPRGLWTGSHRVFPPWEWRKLSKEERDLFR